MKVFLCILCASLMVFSASRALGAVTWSGSYSPTTAWDNTTTGYIGYRGDGSMSVTAGSTQYSSDGYIGGSTASYSMAAGTAAISGGPTAVWNNTNGIYVGYFGTGYLNIQSGALVSDATAYIGYNPGSTGTVNVDGYNGGPSTWTHTAGDHDGLCVGYSGTGYLNITNGGLVSDANGYIGCAWGAAGTVVVDGSGGGGPSMWVNAASLYVGGGGSGALTIRNGGQVSASDSLIGSSYSSFSGTVTVDGAASSWTLTGPFGLTVTNGTLSITNGASVTNSGGTTLVDGAGGLLDFGASGGGTLNTNAFCGSASRTAGTGMINTHGLVTDGSLVFDSPASLTKAIPMANGSGTVTVNLSPVSGTTFAALGAGVAGSGSLVIRNGQQITTSAISLGAYSGTTGTGIVEGAGSKLTGAAGSPAYIGSYGAGTLTIRNGASFDAGVSAMYIGNFGGNGTFTVDGPASTATLSDVFLGYGGAGTLNITNGAVVGSSGGTIWLSDDNGWSGTANVDGVGSRWTNGTLLLGSFGAGTLKITNGGVVTTQYARLGAYNAGSSGWAAVDGAGSRWNLQGLWIGSDSAAGSRGVGHLKITNGGAVVSAGSDRVCSIGSAASVDGAGSSWTNTGSILVNGFNGQAALCISGGGAVSTPSFNIATTTSTSGLVCVDVGSGSSLVVGNGNGTLTIGNGTGSVATLRAVAGASPTAGSTYMPISAKTWTAPTSGAAAVYQAVGGTWDAHADGAGSHVFTVSDVTAGTGGSPVAIDTSARQRLLIADSGNGERLGVSLLANSGTIGLTASSLSGAAVPAAAHPVLDGWTFSSVSGYTAGDPLYLSLAPGRYYPTYGLQYWSYDGSTWSALAADDLTFDGTWASFTATALNGRGFAVTGVAVLSGDANLDGAVNVTDLSKVLTNYDKTGMQWADGDFDGNGTVDVVDLSKVLTNYDKTLAAAAVEAVPEPGTVVMLMAGLVGLLAYAWRKQR